VGIGAILQAADRYFERTGRRLTFEYVLLAKINDSPECADDLVKLLAHRGAMLNVIPYNPVPGLPYETPSPERIHHFRRALWKVASMSCSGNAKVMRYKRHVVNCVAFAKPLQKPDGQSRCFWFDKLALPTQLDESHSCLLETCRSSVSP
jgi:hypothetical protein